MGPCAHDRGRRRRRRGGARARARRGPGPGKRPGLAGRLKPASFHGKLGQLAARPARTLLSGPGPPTARPSLSRIVSATTPLRLRGAAGPV